MPPIPVKLRFFDKFLKLDTPCWLWTASTAGDGYGFLCVRDRSVKAHRLSWMIHNGPIPQDLDVLHTCDNKRCVNPEHLRLGDDKQNSQDMELRGIRVRGKDIHTAKLTDEIVREIRRKFDSGITQKELIKEYKMSNGQISKICRRKNWLHVEEPEGQ